MAVKPKAHEMDWHERKVSDGYSPSAVHTSGNFNSVLTDLVNKNWSAFGDVIHSLDATADATAQDTTGTHLRKPSSGYSPEANFTMNSLPNSTSYTMADFGRK